MKCVGLRPPPPPHPSRFPPPFQPTDAHCHRGDAISLDQPPTPLTLVCLFVCCACQSQVWYCSDECREAHCAEGGGGGHKTQCEALQAATSAKGASLGPANKNTKVHADSLSIVSFRSLVVLVMEEHSHLWYCVVMSGEGPPRPCLAGASHRTKKTNKQTNKQTSTVGGILHTLKHRAPTFDSQGIKSSRSM
jgi:hypothetical protein